MGQRSQIFIRYEYKENENIKKGFVARYFQWNYGERMISRLRHTAEWLKENVRYLPKFRSEEDLVRILETNFDIGDIVHTSDIVDEVIEYDLNGKAYSPIFNDDLFFGNDNNDGILLMDVDVEGNIKYALLDPYNPDIVMNAMEYIAWDETYTFKKNERWKNGR